MAISGAEAEATLKLLATFDTYVAYVYLILVVVFGYFVWKGFDIRKQQTGNSVAGGVWDRAKNGLRDAFGKEEKLLKQEVKEFKQLTRDEMREYAVDSRENDEVKQLKHQITRVVSGFQRIKSSVTSSVPSNFQVKMSDESQELAKLIRRAEDLRDIWRKSGFSQSEARILKHLVQNGKDFDSILHKSRETAEYIMEHMTEREKQLFIQQGNFPQYKESDIQKMRALESNLIHAHDRLNIEVEKLVTSLERTKAAIEEAHRYSTMTPVDVRQVKAELQSIERNLNESLAVADLCEKIFNTGGAQVGLPPNMGIMKTVESFAAELQTLKSEIPQLS